MNELAQTAQPQWSDQPLLDVTTQPAKFLDSDLKRAGIPKWKEEGKIDFHALRTTFTTLVIESGANQKEAMELARHATPLLTFNTYARARQPRLKEITEKVGVEIGACANGVQQDNEDETKEGEKALNNSTYKEIKVAERAGFEPAVHEKKGLTSSGQRGSNSGQKLSNTGQLLGMRSGADVEERTGNGQPESSAGQNLALKWPQKDPERFPSDLKPTLLAELQEVAEAWEELPGPLKDGILAIVRGQPKKAK